MIVDDEILTRIDIPKSNFNHSHLPMLIYVSKVCQTSSNTSDAYRHKVELCNSFLQECVSSNVIEQCTIDRIVSYWNEAKLLLKDKDGYVATVTGIANATDKKLFASTSNYVNEFKMVYYDVFLSSPQAQSSRNYDLFNDKNHLEKMKFLLSILAAVVTNEKEMLMLLNRLLMSVNTVAYISLIAHTCNNYRFELIDFLFRQSIATSNTEQNNVKCIRTMLQIAARSSQLSVYIMKLLVNRRELGYVYIEVSKLALSPNDFLCALDGEFLHKKMDKHWVFSYRGNHLNASIASILDTCLLELLELLVHSSSTNSYISDDWCTRICRVSRIIVITLHASGKQLSLDTKIHSTTGCIDDQILRYLESNIIAAAAITTALEQLLRLYISILLCRLFQIVGFLREASKGNNDETKKLNLDKDYVVKLLGRMLSMLQGICNMSQDMQSYLLFIQLIVAFNCWDFLKLFLTDELSLAGKVVANFPTADSHLSKGLEAIFECKKLVLPPRDNFRILMDKFLQLSVPSTINEYNEKAGDWLCILTMLHKVDLFRSSHYHHVHELMIDAINKLSWPPHRWTQMCIDGWITRCTKKSSYPDRSTGGIPMLFDEALDRMSCLLHSNSDFKLCRKCTSATVNSSCNGDNVMSDDIGTIIHALCTHTNVGSTDIDSCSCDHAMYWQCVVVCYAVVIYDVYTMALSMTYAGVFTCDYRRLPIVRVLQYCASAATNKVVHSFLVLLVSYCKRLYPEILQFDRLNLPQEVGDVAISNETSPVDVMLYLKTYLIPAIVDATATPSVGIDGLHMLWCLWMKVYRLHPLPQQVELESFNAIIAHSRSRHSCSFDVCEVASYSRLIEEPILLLRLRYQLLCNVTIMRIVLVVLKSTLLASKAAVIEITAIKKIGNAQTHQHVQQQQQVYVEMQDVIVVRLLLEVWNQMHHVHAYTSTSAGIIFNALAAFLDSIVTDSICKHILSDEVSYQCIRLLTSRRRISQCISDIVLHSVKATDIKMSTKAFECTLYYCHYLLVSSHNATNEGSSGNTIAACVGLFLYHGTKQLNKFLNKHELSKIESYSTCIVDIIIREYPQHTSCLTSICKVKYKKGSDDDKNCMHKLRDIIKASVIAYASTAVKTDMESFIEDRNNQYKQQDTVTHSSKKNKYK